MKKYALLLILLLSTGCSTAPIAGFLDNVRPSRATVADTRPPAGATRLPPATGKDDAFLDPPKFEK